jgi:hypothetical protein
MSNLEQKIDTLTGTVSTVASAVARVEGWCEEHGRLHVHIDKALDRIDGDTRENTRSLALKRGKTSAPPPPANRWQALGQALGAVPLKTYLAIVAITFALCMSFGAQVSNGSTAAEVVAAVSKHKAEIIEIFNATMDAHDELTEAVNAKIDAPEPEPEPVADEEAPQ